MNRFPSFFFYQNSIVLICGSLICGALISFQAEAVESSCQILMCKRSMLETSTLTNAYNRINECGFLVAVKRNFCLF